MERALGLIETRGLVGTTKAADAMVKTALVEFVRYETIGAGVGIGPPELVDRRAMQIRDRPEVGFELGEAAVHVDSRMSGVVAAPDGDRRAPETIAADRPVARAFQPVPEQTVAHVSRDPVDLLVDQLMTRS